MAQGPIYFIYGHTDITFDEFDEHYKSKIRKSNAKNPSCRYLVGNSQGCDQLTQIFLREIGVSPERIRVCYRAPIPPENPYGYNLHEFQTKREAELYMIKRATCHISWSRSIDDSSVIINNQRKVLNYNNKL